MNQARGEVDIDIEITLLGAFSVTVAGARVDEPDWRRRQAAALVKILALAPRRSLHREQVMDVLWPALDAEEAAPRLHKAAFYARRTLGRADAVVLSGDTVTLFPQQRVLIDAVAFEAARRVFALTALGMPPAAGQAAGAATAGPECCRRTATNSGRRKAGIGCSCATSTYSDWPPGGTP